METEEKASLKSYLDNVFGDEGLRTDLTITMTDETLQKTSLYLVGTGLVITLIVFGIRGIVRNMETN